MKFQTSANVAAVNNLLQLLLGAKLVRMSTLLLPAVSSARGKTGVALAAHLLLAIESLGEGSQGGIVHTTTQTKHQVQCRLLLNIVIAKGASIF